MPDSTAVLQPGPWVHRNLSAGGISFHAAVSGTGEHTVLFLHAFPLNWWSWRHQVTTLAQAGYQCVAMDLRGFGGSDRQPGEVDILRLTTDALSVLRSLGCESFTVVGAGMGGAITWCLAHQAPVGLSSVVTISAPHPLTRYRSTGHNQANPTNTGRLLRLAATRRRHLQDGRLVESVLEDWSAPESLPKIRQIIPIYAEPLRRRMAAEAAWETYHATQHISLGDRHLFENPITIPVWSIGGNLDPHTPNTAYANDSKQAMAEVTHYEVPQVGHFVSEEAPEALDKLLLQHLSEITKR